LCIDVVVLDMETKRFRLECASCHDQSSSTVHLDSNRHISKNALNVGSGGITYPGMLLSACCHEAVNLNDVHVLVLCS
jgi:hypothetical protein